MGAKVDMVGKRFGRWSVIQDSAQRSKSGTIRYLCRCDCGTVKTVGGASLRNGTSVSCGCYNREVITNPNKVRNEKLYAVWNGMKQRCANKNDKKYRHYGGRGIRVCDEWRSDYSAFKNWSEENGYKPGLSIDRENNDGPYSPNNCRWVTTKIQNSNNRRNRKLTIDGLTKTITEWAESTGVKPSTITRRIELGWPLCDLFRPVIEKYSHSEEIKKGCAVWRNTKAEITEMEEI